MNHIRTVKPGLFKHEDLFDAEQASGLPLRLAFIGLFTVVDCQGRFKWKPRTIKLDVLPHDTVDFASVLNALEQNGFIQSYTVAGVKYGWIPSFTKHQRLQTKEIDAGSDLPGYDDRDQATNEPDTKPEPTKNATECVPVRYRVRTSTLPESQEGKGKEGKGREEEGSIPSSPSVPSSPPSARNAQSKKTPLPADLAITPALQAWAEQHGYGDLAAHLDSFRDKAIAKGYRYADWGAALRNAIRDDWAGLRKAPVIAMTKPDLPVSRLSPAGEQQRRNLEAWLQQDSEVAEVAHELH